VKSERNKLQAEDTQALLLTPALLIRD